MVNDAVHIAVREMKMGFRNPWSYSFMGLFGLFMLCLLLINNGGYVEGYSSITGTMLNLILYLLPLMTLMLGAFSLTGDKEDGSWELLSSYPLRTLSFILGKFAGLAVVLFVLVSFGFGLSAVMGWITGRGLDAHTYILLYGFSISLALMFLAVSFLIGTVAVNRWQALTVAVAVWFFAIIAWSPLLIAVLGMMPYGWIKPSISVLTLFNPAELSRIFAVVKLGGGSVLGPQYYDWVRWIRQPMGSAGYIIAILVWIGASTGLTHWLWERGRAR